MRPCVQSRRCRHARHRVAGGEVFVQSGAGVVADSRPEREFEETLEKAGAMFKAVEMAEGM